MKETGNIYSYAKDKLVLLTYKAEIDYTEGIVTFNRDLIGKNIYINGQLVSKESLRLIALLPEAALKHYVQLISNFLSLEAVFSAEDRSDIYAVDGLGKPRLDFYVSKDSQVTLKVTHFTVMLKHAENLKNRSLHKFHLVIPVTVNHYFTLTDQGYELDPKAVTASNELFNILLTGKIPDETKVEQVLAEETIACQYAYFKRLLNNLINGELRNQLSFNPDDTNDQSLEQNFYQKHLVTIMNFLSKNQTFVESTVSQDSDFIQDLCLLAKNTGPNHVDNLKNVLLLLLKTDHCVEKLQKICKASENEFITLALQAIAQKKPSNFWGFKQQSYAQYTRAVQILALVNNHETLESDHQAMLTSVQRVKQQEKLINQRLRDLRVSNRKKYTCHVNDADNTVDIRVRSRLFFAYKNRQNQQSKDKNMPMFADNQHLTVIQPILDGNESNVLKYYKNSGKIFAEDQDKADLRVSLHQLFEGSQQRSIRQMQKKLWQNNMPCALREIIKIAQRKKNKLHYFSLFFSNRHREAWMEYFYKAMREQKEPFDFVKISHIVETAQKMKTIAQQSHSVSFLATKKS